MFRKKKISRLRRQYHNFAYKHTVLAILIAVLTIVLIDTALVTAILVWFSSAGYFGAFIGGLMLVSSFVAAPGAVLLLSISNNVELVPAILIAAVGSVTGDWLILHVINDKIGEELRPALMKYKVIPVVRKLRRGSGKWVVALIGAIITMLPMPDEFGVALMGISSFKRRNILIICFFLNIIGLIMLLVVGRALTGEVNI